MLNTTPNVLRRWIKLGKLRCKRKVGRARNPWFFIPGEEVDRFKKFLEKENERWERVRSEGAKFAMPLRCLAYHTLPCTDGIDRVRLKL